MIAKLSADGVLTLKGLTQVEQYAIGQWWKNFNQGDESSVLEVVTPLTDASGTAERVVVYVDEGGEDDR